MSLASIFCVSQPRSGHHVLEMMLRAALGQRFHYCEFYTEPGCCGAIPCRRRGEFAAEHVLFMQKSHDLRLQDPVPADVDVVLVQIREPTLRALSNYELDLRFHGLTHTREYLEYFLAAEAFYTVGFSEKWLVQPVARRLVLKYEDLIGDPRRTLEWVFTAARLPPAESALQAGAAEVRYSSIDRSDFTARTLAGSRFFDQALFAEFVSLVWRDARYLGYGPWTSPDVPAGRLSAIYEALRASSRRDFARVATVLEPFLGAADAWPALRQMHADALHELGQVAQSRAALEALVADRPDYLDAYLALAMRASERGDVEAARAHIRAGVTRTGRVARAREFVTLDWPDAELLAWLGAPSDAVTREEVAAAYRWIFGREPESEAAFTAHQRCLGVADLRRTLLQSSEFRTVYPQLMARPPAAWRSSEPGAVAAADVQGAFYWILGRAPESEPVIQAHLGCGSVGELRQVLFASAEFRTANGFGVVQAAE